MALRASQRHFRRIAARNTSVPGSSHTAAKHEQDSNSLEPEAPCSLGGAVEVTPHVTEALATGGAVSPFLALITRRAANEKVRRSCGVDTHPVPGRGRTPCLKARA